MTNSHGIREHGSRVEIGQSVINVALFSVISIALGSAVDRRLGYATAVAVIPLAIYVSMRCFMISVCLLDDEIHVHNSIRTYRVPWSTVERIDKGMQLVRLGVPASLLLLRVRGRRLGVRVQATAGAGKEGWNLEAADKVRQAAVLRGIRVIDLGDREHETSS